MKKLMNTRRLSLLIAVIFTLIISPSNLIADPLQGGKIRNVSEFSELNLAISANVFIKQGNSQKVEIHASDNLLSKIETEVKGNALHIKWNEKNVRHSEKINIYITMEKVNALRIAGSGDISAKDLINTTNLELKISGSGNINLEDVKAESLSAKISGSADIEVKGGSTLNDAELSISGSGNIKTEDLPVNDVSVAISGSGDCRVYAKEKLKAKVAGSGDVYYKGKATVDIKVAGSGSVKQIN